MGKKSGPPTPPPQPDDTRQREAAVAAENADRASLASDYNDRIKLFNSANVKLLDLVSGSLFNVFKSFTALLEPKYISAGDHLLISPNLF